MKNLFLCAFALGFSCLAGAVEKKESVPPVVAKIMARVQVDMAEVKSDLSHWSRLGQPDENNPPVVRLRQREADLFIFDRLVKEVLAEPKEEGQKPQKTAQ